MTKRRICIIITTRGNYAKMKSVIRAVRAREDLELSLIFGGGAILPKYGNIADAVDGAEFAPDRRIHFLVEGENPVAMAKSAGLAVTEFATVFEGERPDVVVVIADRFECLAIAMAGTYMNIPLAHVEGGEVSGSIDESVRHSITKLAQIHFPATDEAAARIERMGEPRSSIFTVGATSLDVLGALDLRRLDGVAELQRRSGLGRILPTDAPYLVVIQHPVTTEYDRNLAHVNETIRAVSDLRMNTFWIWPNMDAGADGVSKGLRLFHENQRPDHVHFFRSLPIEAYGPLLANAACIVGNSSSGIRESAFLGTPCVNVGSRQTGRQRGPNVVDAGYSAPEIVAAVRGQLDRGRYAPSHLYGDGNAGRKIVDVLATYPLSVQKRISF